MKIVGVVGGIGSGKSFFTYHLKSLGACSINADRLAHDILTFPEIMDQMSSRWRGLLPSLDEYDAPEVNDAFPGLLRASVSAIVFDNPEELAFLQSILFPVIDKRLQESIARYHPNYTNVLILDAPLLYEAEWDVYCNFVVFIDTPLETRIQNASNRTNGKQLSEADLLKREAVQLSLEKKQKYAKFTIKNHGTKEEFQKEIEKFWANIND